MKHLTSCMIDHRNFEVEASEASDKEMYETDEGETQ